MIINIKSSHISSRTHHTPPRTSIQLISGRVSTLKYSSHKSFFHPGLYCYVQLYTTLHHQGAFCCPLIVLPSVLHICTLKCKCFASSRVRPMPIIKDAPPLPRVPMCYHFGNPFEWMQILWGPDGSSIISICNQFAINWNWCTSLQ